MIYFRKKILFISTFLWLMTIILNNNFFQNTMPVVSHLYPVSPENNFYIKYCLLEILDFLIIYFLLLFSYRLAINIKNRNEKSKLFLEGFVISFIILLVYLIFNFPGQWAGDSLHLLEYAKSLRLIPWHNIFTSIFYIVSCSFIPHAAGVVIFQYFFISLILAYIYSNIFYSHKNIIRFLFFIILVTPINLFYANWVFRTTISSYLELFIVFYIIFNRSNILTNKKNTIILILLIGFLSSYRSENFIYLLLPLFLIKKNEIKRVIKIIIICCFSMFVINIPQKICSSNYYNYEYLILNTFESLQYIVNSIPEDEISEYYSTNISNIIAYDYIKDYGSHSFFENNYDKTKYATILLNSRDEQIKYLIDVMKLFYKYKSLFLYHKINGFTELLFSKSFFPSDKVFSKRTEYYFKDQLDIINRDFKEKYTYIKDQNPNIKNKTSISLIITFLLFLVCLIKKRKIAFICFLLLSKTLLVALVCPNTIFMYFYFLYLISFYLLIYNIFFLKISNKKSE